MPRPPPDTVGVSLVVGCGNGRLSTLPAVAGLVGEIEPVTSGLLDGNSGLSLNRDESLLQPAAPIATNAETAARDQGRARNDRSTQNIVTYSYAHYMRRVNTWRVNKTLSIYAFQPYCAVTAVVTARAPGQATAERTALRSRVPARVRRRAW